MGNRGVLHDAAGVIGPARWRHRNWVICRLAFKSRRRALRSPGHYTELFFHDEAVALAAGHRPCGECRRDAYRRFLDLAGEVAGRAMGPRALDVWLHEARAVPGARRMRTHRAQLEALPDGAMFRRDGVAHLVRGDLALPFGAGGYGPPAPLGRGEVEVLTNPRTLAVIRAGYGPLIGPSAAAVDRQTPAA
ncbi:MAG: hypothetical protein ACU0BF_02100 [Paracoccaceae bacterium]